MYAIVEIAGQQFKVEEKQNVFVHRLNGAEGSKVEFSDVLLVDENGKVKVGLPYVKGALIKAKIIEHVKGDKVIVFKKKRRKGYRIKNGHRQMFSKLEIEKIQMKGASQKDKISKKVKSTEKYPEKKVNKPTASAKKSTTKKTASKTTPKKKSVKADTKSSKNAEKKKEE